MTLKPLVVKFAPRLLSANRSQGSSSATGNPLTDSRGRPPTIGSRPSKAPLSPVDSALSGRVGLDGYIELGDDAWNGLELDEGRKMGGKGESLHRRTETGGSSADDIEAARSKEEGGGDVVRRVGDWMLATKTHERMS
jgi:hypothetical protein